MDENEKLNIEPEQLDDTLEEKDGVKYETNDNWEFEASAPTLENDITLENQDYEISIDDFDEKPEEKKESYETLERPKAQPKSEEEEDEAPKPPKKASKNKLKFIATGIIVAIVIGVVTFFGVRYYCVPNGREDNKMNAASCALTVDGTKVSIGMYNYYYSSVKSYYEQYASQGYFDLDTTKPYDEQYKTTDDGKQITWEQFFRDEVIKEIRTQMVYYNAGVDAGVTVTDKQAENIDTQMDSLQTSAESEGVTLDQYIAATFGEYCTEETIRFMLEQYYITANYKAMYIAQTRITDEEIDAYFAKHEDDYYSVTFSYLAFEYDSDDTDAMDKKISGIQKKMKDADSVKALVADVYADYIKQDAQMYSEQEGVTKEQAQKEALEYYQEQSVYTCAKGDCPFDDETTEWLFSKNTSVGATKAYIDSEAGYVYIVLKTEEPKLEETESYSVRHILVMPESDETDENGQAVYTDKQWEAAEKKATKLLAEYTKGEKTEYAFAVIADVNSADTGSTSAGNNGIFGGLYEGVKLGEMVPEFEAWATNKDRKYGDTGIVKSEHGYHIMFFISHGPLYKTDIIKAVRSEKLDNMVEEAKVKEHKAVIKKANGIKSVVTDAEETPTTETSQQAAETTPTESAESDANAADSKD
jgi:hypothetical protein